MTADQHQSISLDRARHNTDTANVVYHAARELLRSEDSRWTRTERLRETECKRIKNLMPKISIGTDQNRATAIEVTEDFEFKDFIDTIVPKVLKAIRSNMEANSRSAHDCNSARVDEALDHSHRKILDSCIEYKEDWGKKYSGHVFRPDITVFMRALKSFASAVCNHSGRGMYDNAVMPKSDPLAKFRRFVLRVFGSWRFINAERAYYRQANENFQSARNLIFKMAENHSKLLIIRIDLYYKPFFDIAQGDKEFADFTRWLRSDACRSKLLNGYLGFIAKRENGIIRGIHWHLMIICDGNIHQNCYHLTRQLGEVWEMRTGQGLGSYYNCYVNSDKYKFNGLGLLTLDDEIKMIGLRIAIWYMSKQDCVLKPTNLKDRNFFRTPVVTTCGIKRGRPRSDDCSLRLLKKSLGGHRSKLPLYLNPSKAPTRR